MNYKKVSIFLIPITAISVSAATVFGVLAFSKQNKRLFNATEIRNSIFELNIKNNDSINFATCFAVGDNYFVTNYHPFIGFTDFDSVSITLKDSNSKLWNSYIAYKNELLDIAILRTMDSNDAENIKIKESFPKTGDKCYCYGNANGLGIAFYEGTISNPSISLKVDGVVQTFIQSKNDIYPGCSGGCLLNSNGQLIGMLSFRTKDANGIPVTDFAYSIPSSRIMSELKNVKEGNKV